MTETKESARKPKVKMLMRVDLVLVVGKLGQLPGQRFRCQPQPDPKDTVVAAAAVLLASGWSPQAQGWNPQAQPQQQLQPQQQQQPQAPWVEPTAAATTAAATWVEPGVEPWVEPWVEPTNAAGVEPLGVEPPEASLAARDILST